MSYILHGSEGNTLHISQCTMQCPTHHAGLTGAVWIMIEMKPRWCYLTRLLVPGEAYYYHPSIPVLSKHRYIKWIRNKWVKTFFSLYKYQNCSRPNSNVQEPGQTLLWFGMSGTKYEWTKWTNSQMIRVCIMSSKLTWRAAEWTF